MVLKLFHKFIASGKIRDEEKWIYVAVYVK